MKARLISFGMVEVKGQRYDHDVVIERGRIRKRKKAPSKPFRDEFGHTPVSVEEAIPWSARTLVIGTGANGDLPVMNEVYEEARRRKVKLIAEPTARACARLADTPDDEIAAVLHVTC